MYGVESCNIAFLGGHFLFTCSDTFAVGYIVWPQCTALQTDGQTKIYHANSPIIVPAVRSDNENSFISDVRACETKLKQNNSEIFGKYFRIVSSS